MSCLYPWDNSIGGRAVVETVLLLMNNSALGGSVSRGVGSVMLRDVGFFGVTSWYSEFWGRLSLP